MPGDEHKTMNRAENHARSAIISSTVYAQTSHNSISRTTCTSQKGVNKMPKCILVLAIVKNCLKRLGKAHTTQTKPGPSHGRPDR